MLDFFMGECSIKIQYCQIIIHTIHESFATLHQHTHTRYVHTNKLLGVLALHVYFKRICKFT